MPFFSNYSHDRKIAPFNRSYPTIDNDNSFSDHLPYPATDAQISILDTELQTIAGLQMAGNWDIWSARLSTGIFGTPHCKAGNWAPKSRGEILIAFKSEGLEHLVNLGFIPCPKCKPEQTPDYSGYATRAAYHKYFSNAEEFHDREFTKEDFADKTRLRYDSRRLDWETLVPALGAVPGRIYLPQNLTGSELGDFKGRIFTLIQLYLGSSAQLPKLGYYDETVKGRFTEYK